jgi:1-acyl-sn-glycerol-3-phosphate acyltransferase
VSRVRGGLTQGLHYLLRVARTEHGRAGNEGVSAGFGTTLDGVERDAAINLKPNVTAALIEQGTRATYLFQHKIQELLPTEARFNGHDQDHVQLIEQIGIRLDRGGRLQRHRRPGTLGADFSSQTHRCGCGFDVEGDTLGACLNIRGSPTVGVGNHQVRIDGLSDRCGQRLDDGHTDREVRHEVVVHHIHVQEIGARNARGFTREVRKVRVEQARSDPHDTSVPSVGQTDPMKVMQAFVYRVSRHVLIGPALYLAGRPKIIGREHIPKSGPIILTSNHVAVIDSFYVTLAARRLVRWLAKSEYFAAPGWFGRLRDWSFITSGQVPVDRSGGDAAQAALEGATAILAEDGAWGIHPEGTRSPDGLLHRGRTGVMRVAAKTGVPVIPIALRNTLGPWWKKRVHITVLPPIDTSSLDPDDGPAIRKATDALMAAIAEHCGQTYIDTYAKRRITT